MVFTEISIFTRQIIELVSDDSYAELLHHLARLPAAGDLIKGSNGCRKVRWVSAGAGKRGGTRMIYFWSRGDDRIYMLLAYAKAKVSDLSQAQIRMLSQLVARELLEN
jgi:hypothetical protein